jgi:hypothetical protein
MEEMLALQPLGATGKQNLSKGRIWEVPAFSGAGEAGEDCGMQEDQEKQAANPVGSMLMMQGVEPRAISSTESQASAFKLVFL